MCLHTKSTRTYTSSKDIIVYKVCMTINFQGGASGRKYVFSGILSKVLKLNKLLPIQKINLVKDFNPNFFRVTIGYHAYTNLQAADHTRGCQPIHRQIYTATIPAGTKYVRSNTKNEIVAETMIIHSNHL